MAEAVPGIATLPDELLLHIFKLLPVEDLLRCDEVSQRWKVLARDPSIWRDIKIIYNPVVEGEYTTNLRLLETHSDFIQCVEMCNMIYYEKIHRILSACKNLMSIAMYSCDFKDFSDVSLSWMWPQIKKLTFDVETPSLLQFDKFNALFYLKLKKNYNLDLRSLISCANLSHIFIDQIKDLNICEVKVLISSKKHLLKCLHIFGKESIDDECLNLLSECLSLSELVIRTCGSLTDEALLSLASLQNLRVLELCGNDQFTEKALKSFLGSPNMQHLRRLKLFNIENVTPEMLVLISEQCKCLEYLNVLKCHRLWFAFRPGSRSPYDYEKYVENLRKKIKFFYF